MAIHDNLATVPTILFVFLLFISACDSIIDSTSKKEIEKSMEFIPSLTAIDEASNTTLTVNRSSASYFSLNLDGIGENSIISNGSSFGGWCIDYDKPIDSNGGIYESLQLYSSHRTIAWKPLNYFLNIKGDLKQEDPDLSYREIQVVIWSLMPHPEFDLNQISDDDLPSRVMQNGQRNFDENKIAQILNIVESNYRDFHYGPESKFAIVIETPADVQTVITVAGGR